MGPAIFWSRFVRDCQELVWSGGKMAVSGEKRQGPGGGGPESAQNGSVWAVQHLKRFPTYMIRVNLALVWPPGP